jgi:hypothetical protein
LKADKRKDPRRERHMSDVSYTSLVSQWPKPLDDALHRESMWGR